MRLLTLILLILISGCTIQQQRKHAKKRIAYFYGQFPELIDKDSTFTSDTTKSFKSDTSKVFKSDTTDFKKINTDSLANIIESIIDKNDSIVNSMSNKDSIITTFKATIERLRKENTSTRLALKNACKDRIITNESIITINNDSSTVIKNDLRVLEKVPLQMPCEFTFWQMLMNGGFYWLLIAFILGFVVSIIVRIVL